MLLWVVKLIDDDDSLEHDELSEIDDELDMDDLDIVL